MAKLVGGLLRSTATLLYFLEFCCAGIILGIYSYFLSKLHIHHIGIAKDWRAVEGLSGSAVLYTIFAVLLTCFLGGVAFFAFLAIVLDVLFCAAFVALAILTRKGDSCSSGLVQTPLGNGPGDAQFPVNSSNPAGPSLHYACRLNTAAFAVSIIGAFLFAISAFLQILVARHHRKEKKYGPSPANNYTSGSGKRKFWQRKPKNTNDSYVKGGNELGAVGAPVEPATGAHYRPSADTGYTGTTANHEGNGKYTDHHNYHPAPTTAGVTNYHTGPTGTAVNPYGYDSTRPTGTAVNY